MNNDEDDDDYAAHRALIHLRRNIIQDILMGSPLRMADLDVAFEQWHDANQVWQLGDPNRACCGMAYEKWLEVAYPMASLLHKAAKGCIPDVALGQTVKSWMEGN